MHYFLVAINLSAYTIKSVEFWWDNFHTKMRELFLPKCYAFFENSIHAYDLRVTNHTASASAKLLMVYDSSDRIFIQYDSINQGGPVLKTLPILSFEILMDEQVQYDLTDFLEPIRVVMLDDASIVSVAHIVAIWQVSAHIVLDSNKCRASYINMDGDSVVCPISNMDPLFVRRSPDTDSSLTSGSSSDADADAEVSDNSVAEPRVPA